MNEKIKFLHSKRSEEETAKGCNSYVNRKIKNILSIFCIALSIMTLSSVTVYAGGAGNGDSNGGTSTGTTEGGDVHGGSIGGTNDSSGTSKSGGSSKPTGSGSGDSSETPSKPSFYNYTDDWGNWITASVSGYYEDENTYILLVTETLDVTKSTSKKYDWTLDYKQKTDDAYKQIEHKVNGDKEWVYKVENGGYYKMLQTPIVHYTTTRYLRQETTTYRITTGDKESSRIESSRRVKRDVALLSSNKIKEYDVNGSSKKWEGYYYPGSTINGDGDTRTDDSTVDIPVQTNLVK